MRIKSLTLLKEYEGLLRFIITIFVANIFWKLSFDGDENSMLVKFWGIDCSDVFDMMIYHIAEISYLMLNFLGYNVELFGTQITFPNSQLVNIIWGCSGLKQGFIFLSVIFLSKGAIKHKFWYSIIGLFLVYCFNILRIVLLCIIINNDKQYFDFAHEFVLKYLFYFVIFMLWVFWEEKLSKLVGP